MRILSYDRDSGAFLGVAGGRCELRRSPGPGPRRGGCPELRILDAGAVAVASSGILFDVLATAAAAIAGEGSPRLFPTIPIDRAKTPTGFLRDLCSKRWKIMENDGRGIRGARPRKLLILSG